MNNERISYGLFTNCIKCQGDWFIRHVSKDCDLPMYACTKCGSRFIRRWGPETTPEVAFLADGAKWTPVSNQWWSFESVTLEDEHE